MAGAFIPVETILKVDDNELLIGDDDKDEPDSASSSNYVSIGTQCDWKVEPPDDKINNLLPVTDGNAHKYDLINASNISFGERSEDMPLVIRGWPSQCDPGISAEQKFIIPASFSQQFACNIQTLPLDEKFFLQFDYKTRNKLKTKQRRLDPYYRTQERVRQRTVMRIKRQDPRFRAAEREKGRYRMRLKRLDPVFRSQERERQRERMKLKRSNPDFREKEREQQKTRLHVKRLDPAYKERERAQDLLRMRIKQQNLDIYSTSDTEQVNIDSKSESPVPDHSVFKEVNESTAISEIRNNDVVFHESFNAKLLQIRARDPSIETFHYKKQHILNFNFYNSSKEQWATPDEINAKRISQFSIVGDNVKLEAVGTSENNTHILEKNRIIQSKKTYSKQDLISQTLMNIKSQIPTDVEKEKDSLNSESSVIPSYSFSPSSGVIAASSVVPL